MALVPGTRIGAYEVTGPLGAGGMGAGLSRLMAVDIDLRAGRLSAGIPGVRLPGRHRLSNTKATALYDVLPGDRGFVIPQVDPAEEREGNRIHIVLGWANELTTRVPRTR